MTEKGIIVCISGFSGVGKGTLVKRLIEEYPDRYALSISMTTRSPRKGEEDGHDYFFVTDEEFRDKIRNGGLVEYARYCEHYYGTPRGYVQKQLEEGRDVILEIEIQGAMKIREKFPDTLLVFVCPPSMEELKNRLVGRGTETLDVINGRLRRAVEESRGMDKYDYLLINDDLEECVDTLHETLRCERMRTSRNHDFVSRIQKEAEAFL